MRRGSRSAGQAGQSAGAPTSRRKILVVDDNEDAAESLAALLAISGHETRLAHDGPGAVKEAERFLPDVVFLDIGMPMLDGHETAQADSPAAVGPGRWCWWR